MKSYKQARSRKALTVAECQLRLTDAIKQMEKIILSDSKDSTKIQAVHALSGVISKHVALIETQDLIERIEALEALK